MESQSKGKAAPTKIPTLDLEFIREMHEELNFEKAQQISRMDYEAQKEQEERQVIDMDIENWQKEIQNNYNAARQQRFNGKMED